MEFSPDWQTDTPARVDAWVAYKQEFIGRTAAQHQPWVQPGGAESKAGGVPSSALPRNAVKGARGGADPRSKRSPSRQNQQVRGRCARPSSALSAWTADDSDGYDSDGLIPVGRPTWATQEASLAYRSGYAWTQHGFPGKFVKRK